jgi:hypothetical protein
MTKNTASGFENSISLNNPNFVFKIGRFAAGNFFSIAQKRSSLQEEVNEFTE